MNKFLKDNTMTNSLDKLYNSILKIQKRQYTRYTSSTLKLYDKLWNKPININGWVYPVSMVDVLPNRKISKIDSMRYEVSEKYWNNPQWVRTNGLKIKGM